MILSKKTYMKKWMIANLHNNLNSRKEYYTEDEGCEWMDCIIADLKYAYETDNENYLMNILNEWAIEEVIRLSEKWDILAKNFHNGDYETIGKVW